MRGSEVEGLLSRAFVAALCFVEERHAPATRGRAKIRGALTLASGLLRARPARMNKLALLLPLALLACGSEVAEGNKAPAPAPTTTPGAAGTDAVAAPSPSIATEQVSTHDRDIAAVTDGTTITGGHRAPSNTPTPSLPAADPTPATDPTSTTTDPSTTDPTSTTTDPSTTDPTSTADPSSTTDPSTTTTDAYPPPPVTDPPTTTTDPPPTTADCAPTPSGNTPNGKSKGSGSQDGQGNSLSACGGPL